MKRPQVNFRLSHVAKLLLVVMAEQTGISQTAMLEVVLREAARTRDINIAGSQQDANG